MSVVVIRPVGRHTAPPSPRLRGRWSAGWPAGAGIVAALVLLVRPRGTHPWQALWAEDGTVFLNGALWRGGVAVWFQPYMGYLHLIPRMIATVAAAVPLARAPQVFSLASTVLAAGCLVLFGWGLRRWLDRPWMRAAFVVGLAMVDGAAQEIDGNAANLHWFLDLGMLGLGLLRPVRIRSAVLAAAVGSVFALSEGLGLFAVAVALVDAAVRWRRGPEQGVVRVWLVSAAMAAGIGAQLIVTAVTPRRLPPAPVPGVGEVARWYLQQVVGSGIAPGLTQRLGVAALAGLLAVVVLGVAGLTLLSHLRGVPVGSRGWLGSTLLALSVAYFATSAVVNRGLVDRYLGLPAVLLVAGVLVLAAGPRRWQRAVFLGVLASLCAAQAGSVATHARVTRSLPWTSALQHAVAAQCHGAVGTATVPTAPTSRSDPLTAEWTVTVPCPR